MSDFGGAALIVEALPPARHPLAERGYDADWFRGALKGKGIPPNKNRKIQIDYDNVVYRQRHKIENMFGKPKD